MEGTENWHTTNWIQTHPGERPTYTIACIAHLSVHLTDTSNWILEMVPQLSEKERSFFHNEDLLSLNIVTTSH